MKLPFKIIKLKVKIRKISKFKPKIVIEKEDIHETK